MKNALKNLLENNTVSEIEVLALISSAAVLRKYNSLKVLLLYCLRRNIKIKKIYEAVLQTYLFSGFPSALISLQIVSELFPVKNDIIIKKGNFYGMGENTGKKIYGDKFEKLKGNIKSFSPAMAYWFIEEGYGKVLSRAGLSLKERELCIVSILASLKYESQLYSHINGAFRQRASIEIMEKIISNLKILGNKSSSAFGGKVLLRYKENKQINGHHQTE